jgi:hypothetical protein
MHIYTTIFILCSFMALVAAVVNPKLEKRCIDWFENCDPNYNTCCNDAACVPVWASGKGVSAEYYYAFHGFLFISHSSIVLFLRVSYGMETLFLPEFTCIMTFSLFCLLGAYPQNGAWKLLVVFGVHCRYVINVCVVVRIGQCQCPIQHQIDIGNTSASILCVE